MNLKISALEFVQEVKNGNISAEDFVAKTLERIHEPICFRIHDNDITLDFPNLGCDQIFLKDIKTVKITK